MPYSTDDFRTVTQILTAPLYLIANPKTPATTFDDLVRYAKDHPGEITIATSGPGDITSLPVEILDRAAGIQLKQVPYLGAAPSITATISGEVNLTISIYPTFAAMLKEGRVKVLAVAGDSRSPALPDVPTIKEVVPSYSGVTEWYGVVVPKETPAPLIEKLYADITKALATKELRDRFSQDGTVVVASNPDQFAAFLKAQTEVWRKPISDMGLSLELN
jgi:tripartite-type tricarboxylate transporter receptor subunit TctC